MAVVRNLMVRAGADFSAITKQAKKASASVKGMGAAFTSAGSVIKKAMGAIGVTASLAGIAYAAKSAKEAYDKQAEAEAKLTQVMRNTMKATSSETQSIMDLTAAQQQLGVIGDEVQLAGAQELATYLEKSATLKKLIPVMNDMVAQQYGYSASAENAANVATMLGKVMDGQTGALSRYGYKFDEAQEKILKYGTEEQRAATLAEVVEASVGGMNQALANTPSGRMQQLSNTLGDIKEQFGAAVTSILTAFLPALNALANVLAKVAAFATRVAQVIANVFGGGEGMGANAAIVAVGAGAASDSLDEMAESATGAGKAAKEASKSVMGFDKINKLSESQSASGSNTTAASSGGSAGGLLDAFDFDSSPVSKWASDIEDILSDLFSDLKDLWNDLKAVVTNVWENIKKRVDFKQFFKDIVTTLQGVVQLVSGILSGDWSKAFQGAANIVQGVVGIVNGCLDLLGALVDSAIGWVSSLINSFFSWLEKTTGLDLSKYRNLVEKFLGIVKECISNSIEDLKTVLRGLADFVGGVLTGDWSRAWRGIGQVVDGVVNQVVNSVYSMINGIISKINWMLDSASQLMQYFGGSGFSWRVGYLNTPTVSVSTPGTTSARAVGGHSGRIGEFASGGFPDVGELYIAREAGPEMVGTIGGRNAVATNPDIVAAIEQGVYRAVVSAMSGSGGSGRPIELTLDGRTLAEALLPYNRAAETRHGSNLIMGVA